MHTNSGGALVHRNSCNSRGDDVRWGTKPLSLSTQCMSRRPASGDSASSQQASTRFHGEAWAGRVWVPQPDDVPGGGNRNGVCRRCVLPSTSRLCCLVTWTC